ncbi:MAG: Glycosyl transferase group 1 [Limisphaerales bacterium]|nr:MAG: Glycosyl transferase group 1 [Limisphaerales bacterium]KAG0508421.1 MAG: Glycosyl transferase group 1 [Limisphaerales bacterium]TXT49875.1 MAG: Glycosyl transferase group 1 [Limisphaerales bacterium]
MNLVQITPGAGGMYCGNCFRDNALVAALRQRGHEVLMVPLYLPMTLDEESQAAGVPTFFGGINVYLQQQSAFFRRAPKWLHSLLDSPALLKLAAGRAAKTQAADVGELTLSMLRGEEGNQVRELDELVAWLKTQPRPDVVLLSNALLVGFTRKLKAELGCKVVCNLQGEDAYLDSMPSPLRERVWALLAERCRDCDLFIAPSRYFGDTMAKRLNLPADKVRVVFNGISLEGYGDKWQVAGDTAASATPLSPATSHLSPTLGYFARMCREKGLDLLVETFIELKRRNAVPGLKLKVGGGCGPGDEPFVAQLKEHLRRAGCLDDVSFHPNLTREQKVAFLQSLTVFSVPALYGEGFGLYLIEALAAGVPVVQPRHAAFPELVEATGGGVIAEANAAALAAAIEALLLDPARLRTLGEAGRRAVGERFTVDRMAAEVAQAAGSLVRARG